MRTYFSLPRSRSGPTRPFTEKDSSESIPSANAPDNDRDTTAGQEEATLSPPNLKIKRVDHYFSRWSEQWKYRNTGSSVVVEAVPPGPVASVANAVTPSNDPWQEFCFVVVRKLPQERKSKESPTYKVVIKSPYLVKACTDVMKYVPGLSWTVGPIELDPRLLLTFFPQFEEYEKDLSAKKCSQEDGYVLATVKVLLDYLRKDYHSTLAMISKLTERGEITFDLLYAIFIPRTTLVTKCPVTGATRALRLIDVEKHGSLLCQGYDSVEDVVHGRSANNSAELNDSAPQSASADGGSPRKQFFALVQSTVFIKPFDGTRKINTLAAYPLQYHRAPDTLKKTLIERGREWASFEGVHHVHYRGTARAPSGSSMKYNVDSRVMIDRQNFLKLHTHNIYTRSGESTDEGESSDEETPHPPARQHQNGPVPEADANAFALDARTPSKAMDVQLRDKYLLLASPVLYGYSLTDKKWLALNVEHVQPIIWNEEAFANLVLADDRKHFLRSLVDAHNADLNFDDFIQGKGQGLIINLFGPPGVGKTLSAEATSEHVHRPLYVVGGGDLGTKASEVDAELTRIFDIAMSWKALVLIDEADVFMEHRSLHDLERNAMVAVFLRHIEYYRGILFLTTNRITAIDPAFLSRIHVALHLGELSLDARAHVWRAFLRKAGANLTGSASTSMDEDEIVRRLASREVNGRQIKNAWRTAQSLAYSRREPLAVEHLEETLDVMDDFNMQFAAMSAAARDLAKRE
ncbi:P-loop containing nucleoside triphosphate hydrolase protein [Cubamyces sp. BRFM 1775]|nr:P-loop containing nucleoside triphosphate hydrolase protein [Cubamyces sp. BRFM 1775]